MKIAVIGHGNVGGALTKVWSKAGHEIRIGIRRTSDERAEELAKTNNRIEVYPIKEAVRWAEVVLIAIPASATVSLANELGKLPGKILIDATNAIRERPEPYETGFHAFEHINQAEVVKAFNSTGFENMEDPTYGEFRADMFMAGDSAEAKEVIGKLSKDAGFDQTYDFGGGDKVKALEHFAFAWINLAIMQGQGRDMIFKVLKR